MEGICPLLKVFLLEESLISIFNNNKHIELHSFPPKITMLYFVPPCGIF